MKVNYSVNLVNSNGLTYIETETLEDAKVAFMDFILGSPDDKVMCDTMELTPADVTQGAMHKMHVSGATVDFIVVLQKIG